MAEKTFWAGITDGKIAISDVDSGWGGFGGDSFAPMPMLFTSRKEARRRYQKVVKVRIKIIK